MSTYDPTRLALSTVAPPAVLGVMRLGMTALGVTTAQRTPVPTSAINVTSGYEVGQLGELSLDLVTASGSIAEYGDGPWPDTSTPLLDAGDYVELTYDGAVLVDGFVHGTGTDVESSTAAGGQWVKRTSYTVVSNAALMLARRVSWADALPAEGALPRLRRWFTVDVSAVPVVHVPRLYEPQARRDPGSATLLELAREFTARTLFTLAAGNSTTELRVVWPAAAAPGTADGRTWTRSWRYDTRGQLASLTIGANAVVLDGWAASTHPSRVGSWTPA